jgi:hypothetical protein
MAHRRREPHRPLSFSGSHWRQDGQPKVRFAHQKDALDAAHDRARESGIELGVYRCGFCGGWHMGRRSGRERDDD